MERIKTWSEAASLVCSRAASSLIIGVDHLKIEDLIRIHNHYRNFLQSDEHLVLPPTLLYVYTLRQEVRFVFFVFLRTQVLAD